MEKPKCYYCQGKKARKNSFFCSQKCAALYADEILEGYEMVYCYHCQHWYIDDHLTHCLPNKYINASEWLNENEITIKEM